MALPDLDVSIVVACYNEVAHLERSVGELVAVLDGTRYRYELIFVDDCSRDGTPDLIQELARKHGERIRLKTLFHAENTGRGGAVMDGFRMAEGRVIGYLDIDLEVHARYVPSMVAAVLEGWDGATAFRVYKVGRGVLLRHVLSHFYRWMCRALLRVRSRDTETGFKFFDRERIAPVLAETRYTGWFWDTEVMALAEASGLRITEIPCLFLRRRDKKSTLRVWRDSLEYLGHLVRFRRRLRALRSTPP
jgi:glycosyltransferase involved in cell wall biosynthesis